MKMIHDGERWKAQVTLQGTPIEMGFSDFADDDVAGMEAGAKAALERLDASWAEVLDAVVEELLETYHASWMDEDEGDEELTREQFLALIEPEGVQVFAPSEGWALIMLYFDDGDLFAGHGIEVFFAEGEHTVSLVG